MKKVMALCTLVGAVLFCSASEYAKQDYDAQRTECITHQAQRFAGALRQYIHTPGPDATHTLHQYAEAILKRALVNEKENARPHSAPASDQCSPPNELLITAQNVAAVLATFADEKDSDVLAQLFRQALMRIPHTEFEIPVFLPIPNGEE